MPMVFTFLVSMGGNFFPLRMLALLLQPFHFPPSVKKLEDSELVLQGELSGGVRKGQQKNQQHL